MIVYDRLWQTMKERGISQYKLVKDHRFSNGQLDRLRKNTLNELCTILNCRLDDIAEYIAD